MNISDYEPEEWGFKSLRPRQLWEAPLNGRQLVLKTRVVFGLGEPFGDRFAGDSSAFRLNGKLVKLVLTCR